MTKFNTHVRRKAAEYFNVLVKKPQFVAGGATLAFCLVFAGAFLSQNTPIVSLAPEQIGLGQGVAACFGSLGPSCDSSGRNTLSFSWNATAAAGHSPNCDSNGDPTVRVNLHDNNNAFIQSLTLSGDCSGSASFSRVLTGGGGYKIWVLGNNSNHTYEEYTFTAMSCQTPTTNISGSINVSPDSPCVAAPGSSTCAATVNWSTQGAQYSVAQAAGPLWPSGANIEGPTANSSGSLAYNLPIGGYVFSVSGYDGSDWGDPLSQRTYYVAPAAPTSMSATCNTGGTSVTLSWPASTGATTYYPRIAPVSWTVCTNPAGPNWTWIPDNGGTCYTDRWPYGTTVANFPVNSGTAYQAWVHAGDPVAWGHAAGTGSFTCTGAAAGTVQGYKVNSARQAAFAEQIITVQGGSQAPSSGTNSYFISGLAPAGYDVTSSVPAGYNVSYCTSGCGAGQTGTYTPGSLVNAVVPSGGAVNIWWMYTAPAATPDLTVSGITPTSAVAGVSTNFSATITNTGNGATPTAFKNFYQIKSGTVGYTPKNLFAKLFNIAYAAETITDLTATDMAALAAGGSGAATQVYTFPAAGVYGIRVCADKENRDGTNGNPNGQIAELDETNNCGGWTDVNVTSLCTPSCGSGSVCSSGACVLVGGPCTPTNACGQSNSGTYNSAGVCSVSAPAMPATYGNACPSVPATNACGMVGSGTILCNGTCSATAPSDTLCLPTVTLSANPMRVRKDTSTKLTWTSSAATSCKLTGQNGLNYTIPVASLSEGDRDSTSIDAQTTFTLTCSNAYGSKSASVIVNLIPSYIEV